MRYLAPVFDMTPNVMYDMDFFDIDILSGKVAALHVLHAFSEEDAQDVQFMGLTDVTDRIVGRDLSMLIIKTWDKNRREFR